MGGSIPAYVCGGCAKGFTSARSARRHIRGIEKGNAQLYTEAQYRIMLSTGVIFPPMARLSSPSFRKNIPDPLVSMKEEFMRGLYRKLGERAAENMSSDLVKQVSQFLLAEAQLELFRASRDNTS